MTDAAVEALLGESREFAARLDRLVRGVLPDDPLPNFHAEIAGDGHVQVSCPPLPIRRRTAAQPFAVLAVRFNLMWSGEVLAVRGSSFMLRTPSVGGPPVLQFDYLREAGRDLPASHINVSSQHRGLLRMVDPDDTASTPKSSDSQTHKLHLPTGGHRFRPSLEDVLHMIVSEFDIERRESWRATIAEHRRHYREIQTMAAVRDHPQRAVEELTKLGYSVRWVGEGYVPSSRPERLGAF